MILQTSRLTLRPLRAEDTENLHALFSDVEVMAYWDWEAFEDITLTASYLQGQLDAMAKERACHWAMLRNEDNVFVGCCDLSEIDRAHHRAEIGFMVGRAYWGDGYTLEAMHAVIDHAAVSLRLRRLSARTHLGNVRSVKLLERLGFEEEGLLRGYVDREGERRDCQMFGLLL
jgi:ribosomal-protein-alanine N-acetyltransferase